MSESAEESKQEQQSGKQRSKKRDSKQVAELKQQIEDLTEDLQRERSDFANYQRRAESEKEQIMTHAKSDIITQLLPLFDDLERALAHIPEELSDNTWAQGVAKVYEQAQEKMNELGVAKIDALHRPFDPQLHEAVEFEDGDGSEEVVTEEMRTGYMLHDTVLRPAMVKVGKASPQTEQHSTDDQGPDGQRSNAQGQESTGEVNEQEVEGGEE